MATPHAYAHVTPRDDPDPGRPLGFHRPTDRRLRDIPPGELVELDAEQWQTWLLKQDSRWDFKRGKLEVRAGDIPKTTPADRVSYQLERRVELLAFLRVLSRRLGVPLEELRSELAAEAEAALGDMPERLRPPA